MGKKMTPMGKRIEIAFLYLDRSVCMRCRQTESLLDEAVAEIREELERAGVSVRVRKIHVQSEAQAVRLGFSSSPMIRVNGRDIQPDVKESRCESCGDLCGENDIACRVWTYRDKEYTAPPKEMIIEAILRAVDGRTERTMAVPPSSANVPENLKRFFSKRAMKGADRQAGGRGFKRCCSGI